MGSQRDGLECLLPIVADWFRATYGTPTPAQREGWPAIASGRSTLIFAPTGSGKTLAAFLACLDQLWREPERIRPDSCRILYLSPLKALNHDIERNLRVPLEGVHAQAEAAGQPLRPLTVSVRTGDTPAADRRSFARKPSDILITTPESLHLLLTSRARDALRGVTHVIVDEIHAVCSNKRGVFLSLLLERLEAINPDGFVRVGLSATQRPLDEVARYLGGLRKIRAETGFTRFESRPVQIVDSGQRKDLDLEVSLPSTNEGPSGVSVWPALETRLIDLIRGHRSTIVFANNRRLVERLTASLNERAGLEQQDDQPDFARAHHGSLSLDERRSTEEALKQGELAAVVSTASLEMGIDMGAVDLVCQVESPGSVARGLQRVGRAGHLVGRTSKGRLLAKTLADLLESAALCRSMVAGEVEPLRVPTNCLDVLAQQVVACVAMDPWSVPDLFDLVRCAYPYRDLTAAAFESVLMMIAGRFPSAAFRDLRARVSWDRVHNTLLPLPGTAQLAIVGGGTIPDTGQYPLILGEDGPRLGQLDEEFVLERRVGETFVFGTSTWRIEAIEPLRVVVSRAEGQSALMPFWRGEDAPRTAELGEALGSLVREVVDRLEDPDLPGWLESACRLDAPSAVRLRDHVARQIRLAGAAPDDRTILVESFRDEAGELGVAVLSPFGGKVHHGLKLVIQAQLHQRLGISVSGLHSDDGVIFRLPGMDDPPLDLFAGLSADTAESLLRDNLGESALFGLRFRQNAARGLLMPRPDPSKRTPLWLQRLRAKDLLQVVRNFPDFPIVIETYRECLVDDMDLPRLRRLFDAVDRGAMRVIERRGVTASPFARELIFKFAQRYLYEWDEPKPADPSRSQSRVNSSLLDPLLEPVRDPDLLDPIAIGRVDHRLRELGAAPRTVDEMAETLRRLGDLTDRELFGPMDGFVRELERRSRAVRIELAVGAEPGRWILAEEAEEYSRAFRSPPEGAALEFIIGRFLRTRALTALDDLLGRYPMEHSLARELLEEWSDRGDLVAVEGETTRWADRRNLHEVRRLSIALRRRESLAVSPEQFADFVARRQRVVPSLRREGRTALSLVLEQLAGYAAPADLWESEIFPRRVRDYRPSWIDDEFGSGAWFWRARNEGRGEPHLAFFARDFEGTWTDETASDALEESERAVLDQLTRQGASFVDALCRSTGLGPSVVRNALGSLASRGLVNNDRLDPLRPGGQSLAHVLADASSRRSGPFRSRQAPRRPASVRPEGRWSRLDPPDADPETSALAWATVILERYGLLTRETLELDPWAPPWRDVEPHLSRAEWRGELRRGYFVEGLSGVQYSTNEAAESLASGPATGRSDSEPFLLSTLDPANLYGSGAPLDIPLLEGGSARLIRSTSSYLVLIGGRPVLMIEGTGKRLTGLATATDDELRRAIRLVPELAGGSRRILKVETYNALPALSSPAATWLAEAGFVRDPPGMAFYAGW